MTKFLARIAKIVDDAVWDDPEAIGPDRQLFLPRALKLRSEKIQDGRPVLVRVDHVKDGSKDIGRVTGLSEVKDLDGRWVIAHCDVDNPPRWLNRDTPVSMSWCNLGTRRPMPGGWTRHSSGMVTEVSLLSPGGTPAEPGAKVWHIFITEPAAEAAPQRSSSAVRAATSPSAAGEVFYGGPLIRRNIGRVLSVTENGVTEFAER